MNCPSCGARNDAAATACASCGISLTATPPPPPPPPGTAAGSTTWHDRSASQHGPWALDRWVGGDWIGAILAAVVGLVAILLLSVALLGINPPKGASVGDFICKALAWTALAGGGSVKFAAQGHQFGDANLVSVSAMPTFFTLVGFGLMAVVFTKRLRRRVPTIAGFVQQAVRLLVVVAALLIAVGLAAHHGDAGTPHYVRVAVVYTTFFGACVTLVMLALTFFFAFANLLTGQLRGWRDALAGPAAGVVTVVVVAWVLATVYALVQVLADPHHLATMSQVGLFTDSTNGRRTQLAALLAYNLNHAMFLLSWAMGAAVRLSFGPGGQDWRLTHFTSGSAAYWVLPVVAVVVWLIGGCVAALYGANAREGQRNGLRLPIAATVLMLGVFVFVGIAIKQPHSHHAVRLHFVFGWLLLVYALWALVAGLIGAGLVMRLPAGTVARLRRPLVRRYGAHESAPAAASPAPPPPPAPPGPATPA